MGGGDKALLRIGGRTILDHIVGRLAPQVETLALNANADISRFAECGLPVCRDTIAGGLGPLAGILSGMEWCARHHPDIPDIVTVPGDVPFLPGDLVARLADSRRSPGDAVIAESRGRRHPVVGLWPVTLAPTLRRMLINEAVRKVAMFAERCRAATAVFPAGSVDPFTNVNTPEDLAQAERLMEAVDATPAAST